MIAAPKVGMTFLHRYWTDATGAPLLYRVTAIRNGHAYIAADGERKAKESVSLENWQKVFGEAK
jgi:hypothetical protein